MEDNTPPRDESEAFAPRSRAALRELEERARAALSAQQGHLSRLEDQISKQLEAISAAVAEERVSEAECLKEAEVARTNADKLRQELEEARAAWEAQKDKAEAELEQRHAELEKLTADNNRRAEQLGERARELDAQQAKLEKQTQELAERETQLKSAGADYESASQADRAVVECERDELQQKFELALQDVQRFRGRAADLEQELARRPEANQSDSVELVALRAERDALAERVEELERQPVAQVDADTEQQIADLRRRFELAVEDVRELKTKNAELEAKLAASAQRPAASSDAGGMDWESQKRRLLASLEEATDEDDPLPQKDRVTIENTIDMTDAVVAHKDREIEQLKSQLLAASASQPDRVAREQDEQVKQLLDGDEVIAEHRKRIEKLEHEMEEKLRAAELELSVERAKLARQKAELEELRNDLESQRQSQAPNSPGAAAAAGPRRRWLSKLGLSGDEQG